MKKICVFGASGRTGLQFVEQALSKGYRVLSVVRSQESAMKIPKESEIKIGSAFDGRFINHCIKDCDVIVSLIGHVKNSDPLMQTKITENIISEMQGENVKRLITLTGTGVRKPNDKIPLYDKLGNYIIKKIDPERINDGIEHTKLIESSNLDWTILRVLKLSNFNLAFTLEKKYKLKKHGPAHMIVSRKTVAYKIIEIIESDKWIKEMPVI